MSGVDVQKKEPSDERGIMQDNIEHQQQEIVFPQHENDIWPPAGKERKRSITKNPKIGGLPLIPIQQEKNIIQAQRNIEVS